MVKNSLGASDKFFCDLYCFEPGQAQKPHKHGSSDKIYVVMEGRGMFHIGEDARDIGPGQGVLARAGVEHGVENISKERLTILAFMAPKP
ncbi:MAG TPA: cupin domain-containing protein [Nitrospiria bacterium]